MKFAIGGVPYGVGAPLVAPLADDPAVELQQATPTELIQRLRAGRLAAALVSSIEAARLPGYRIARGLGIGARREVRSVRAFRRRGVPISTVALDRSSATSQALLRILLAGPLRAEVAPGCRFREIAPTRRPDELPDDLVLLIGDDGLAADAGAREAWDLAARWRAFTGLPFVFAVWLLHPEADAAALLPILERARDRGRDLRGSDGTHGAVHYELDDDDLGGLHRFWDEAERLQLATGARPTLWPPAAGDLSSARARPSGSDGTA